MIYLDTVITPLSPNHAYLKTFYVTTGRRRTVVPAVLSFVDIDLRLALATPPPPLERVQHWRVESSPKIWQNFLAALLLDQLLVDQHMKSRDFVSKLLHALCNVHIEYSLLCLLTLTS